MSWKPESWFGFVNGICVILGVLAMLTWMTAGILHAVTHPESSMDKARDAFSESCSNKSAVPNIASNNPKDWTCEVPR